MLGILGAAAVGGGGTAAYSYWSADSSYNRLNVKDALDHNQTMEINELKNQLIANKLSIENAQIVRNDTINLINEIGKRVGTNTAAIKQLAKVGSYLAWRGTEDHFAIKADLC